jgi:hypothetical protein
MARNPAGDWTMADVRNVCAVHHVFCTPPTGGGSHYKVSHPLSREILTIPYQKPIKPIYIRKLVAFIRAVEEAQRE